MNTYLSIVLVMIFTAVNCLTVTPPPPPPHVLVVGGSGYIGSRVCALLSSSGCTVTSLSRTGLHPKSFPPQSSVHGRVIFKKHDVLSSSKLYLESKPDLVISCVGNMRPSSDRSGFFGLNFNSTSLYLENYLPTSRIVELASKLKCENFAYVSSSTLLLYGLAGALEGYVKGKKDAEDSIRSSFPKCCIVSPVWVYGGERFKVLGPLLDFVDGTFLVKGYNKFLRVLKENTASGGIWAQDALGEAFLTRPSRVEDVARCLALGVLGGERGLEGRERMPLVDGSEWVERPEDLVDGPEEIEEVSRSFGGEEMIRKLVEEYEMSTTRNNDDDGKEVVVSLPPLEENFVQSTSGFGKPFEGAFEGMHQYLAPILPSSAILGFFTGMIKYSIIYNVPPA
ncbi:hypothetical protein TrST_g14304 [Triparma strigata]|uniref:NAD-dependent epimerase/dehydratase domain-containing protein n=1 Tax=Triparma strigata TaxID=1606541 RepID=A0A9W7E220_9STRA|nr:hypothetical protein TrST_g14304 [Triparma strigata]